MKKDKKKKKKTGKGKKGELNETGESLADSVGSEGGGAGGGDDGGVEKAEMKSIENEDGSQRMTTENDEGRCKPKETKDTVIDKEKSKSEGVEMSNGKKKENLLTAGVFNDEDWEFGKDSKMEGESQEQELTGGVTSRIKLFETVEAPKPQRVIKRPQRVLKKPESEGAKKNQKLVGDAFSSGGAGKVATLGELHKGPSKYQAGKIGELQEGQGECQPKVSKKSLTKGGKGGNPLEAEGGARDEDQVKLGELHKGPSSVLSKFVELVFLLVSNVRSGLILDKSIYNNFCVGTSMRNSTT